MEYSYTKIKTFQDLEVWKESHVLVLIIYKTTNTFPKEERYGIIDQMRRCAVSITSNIKDVNYLNKVDFTRLEEQIVKVGKILTGLIRSTKNL